MASSRTRRAPRKKRTEEQDQVAFVGWFRLQYPKLSKLLTLGSFGEDIGPIRMNRLKQMGLTPGYPDLVLHLAYYKKHPDGQIEFSAGLFIEMKTKIGVVSESQKEIHELLRRAYYVVEVARDWDEAKEIVKRYIGT
jgi:hypothetical protein